METDEDEERLQIMTEYVEAALSVITSGQVPECAHSDGGPCFDCAYRARRKCAN